MTSPADRARLRRAWILVGWIGVGLVVYFSLTPKPPELDVVQGDKIQHLLAYASLMLWFGQVMTTTPSRRLTGVLLVILGVGLEFAQSLTGYRFYSYGDMAANATGVLLGWALSPPRGPRVFDHLLTHLSPGRVP